MIVVVSPSNNPYFNIAAEEYFFKQFDDDIFFLYVNEPSVVVGKHQNAMAETNYRFLNEKNIKLVRRLSGGGTVYHDLGNLNFSFHKNVSDPAKVSFKQFNEPMVEVLQQFGIPAEIGIRNDILVNGFKVSGHAEHVFRKRVLSHGTLLFDANKEFLSKALKNEKGHYTDKAVKSVRSKVANITDFITQPISLSELMNLLVNHIQQKFDASIYSPNPNDVAAIEQLIAEKYSCWEWNYGYSPKYAFENSIQSEGKQLSVKMEVVKGIIETVKFEGDFESSTLRKLEQHLMNLQFKESVVAELMAANNDFMILNKFVFELLF